MTVLLFPSLALFVGAIYRIALLTDRKPPGFFDAVKQHNNQPRK
jgi:hypothetical protein